MRLIHLTYLRSLCASIIFEGGSPFVGDRFREIPPPVGRYEEEVPFVVLKYYPVKNSRDGKRYRRLPNGLNVTPGVRYGAATQRFLKRHYVQVYRYALEFWVRDPAADVLSDPRTMQEDSIPVAKEGPGILDQALLYIGKRNFFTDGVTPVTVVAGDSGIVTDPAGEMAIYKLYVSIEFYDGIYEIDEVDTLDGARIEINKTEIETV